MTKTVYITGATSGFGKNCARVFAEHGYNLVLTGRRTERLEKLSEDLAANTHIITQDIQNRECVKNDIANLPENFRNIDVLINNAGLALGMGPAHEADLDQWETMVDTNIKGVMYSTRFILPGMVERDSGHIINIGSVAGNWPYPGGNVYGASKAFVKQFSHNLRADILGSKVRVTNIEPGIAETEFSVVRFNGDIEKASEVYEGTESLKAEDIADIALWVTTQPAHVNINRIEVMPVHQSCGPFAIHRG